MYLVLYPQDHIFLALRHLHPPCRLFSLTSSICLSPFIEWDHFIDDDHMFL